MGQIDQIAIRDAERDFALSQCRCGPKGFDNSQHLECSEYVCDNSGACICDCHVHPDNLAALVKSRNDWRKQFEDSKKNKASSKVVQKQAVGKVVSFLKKWF